MPKPSFETLWKVYEPGQPCDGPWANQCAIRMSIALNKEATLTVSAATYTERKCSHGHARGAESLASWLHKKIAYPKVYKDPAKAKLLLANSIGIIFFKDCFTRPGETHAVGDHIDVWQKGLTKTYSDPANKAKAIWFWDLA